MQQNVYIWQNADWAKGAPKFFWQSEKIEALLGQVRHKQGLLAGVLTSVGFDANNEAILNTATQELISSSAIEGVELNASSVRSSIARHLGVELHDDDVHAVDHYVDGLVSAMLDATANFEKPLTEERIFGWHAALFPTGYSGPYKIDVAKWRQGAEAMQVVSGAMGKERVHFQAPPSESVPALMRDFLEWINQPQDTDPVLRAAIAHLWFVTIHPFDDGNGRLCRTITEMMLARADHLPQRFYSMSRQILNERKGYYEILERTQKGSLDITAWIEWFLECLLHSLDAAQSTVEKTKRKALFWAHFRQHAFNARQIKILNMLFDGFFGKLSASKYGKITHCSADTALNDIKTLIQSGALVKNPEGGRSTSYSLPPQYADHD